VAPAAASGRDCCRYRACCCGAGERGRLRSRSWNVWKLRESVASDCSTGGLHGLLDLPLRGLDAVLLERVRGEPGGHAAGALLALVEQDAEHLRDAARVDPGAGHVLHAARVRVGLVLPAEAREQRAGADVDGRPRHLALAHAGREDAEQVHPEAGLLLLLHLLDRVPPGHVPDLVPEHPGHLRHVLRALDEPRFM
jgi:hypothetical protein